MHGVVDAAEVVVAEISNPLAHGVAGEMNSVTHEEVLFLAVVGLVLAEAVGGDLGGEAWGEEAAFFEGGRQGCDPDGIGLGVIKAHEAFDEFGAAGDEFFAVGGLEVKFDGDFFADLAVVLGLGFDFVGDEHGFFHGDVGGKGGFAAGAFLLLALGRRPVNLRFLAVACGLFCFL